MDKLNLEIMLSLHLLTMVSFHKHGKIHFMKLLGNNLDKIRYKGDDDPLDIIEIGNE